MTSSTLNDHIVSLLTFKFTDKLPPWNLPDSVYTFQIAPWNLPDSVYTFQIAPWNLPDSVYTFQIEAISCEFISKQLPLLGNRANTDI